MVLHSLPLLDPRITDSAACDRSLWSVIWACSLTLFACTWVAIHPDAASENDPGRALVARRTGMMLSMLIFPELVIVRAFEQWVFAAHYTRKFAKKSSSVEWTRTHSFFLIMGGFSYLTEDQLLETLTATSISDLYDKGLIEWPKVTVKQIQDHSKADFLSKFIVLIQTTWFSVQLVVRLASGLKVMELEVSTFAFAILNLIVYILWWDKPFDVRSRIVIPGRYSPSPQCKDIASPLPQFDPNSSSESETINEHISFICDPDSIPLRTRDKEQTPSLTSILQQAIAASPIPFPSFPSGTNDAIIPASCSNVSINPGTTTQISSENSVLTLGDKSSGKIGLWRTFLGISKDFVFDMAKGFFLVLDVGVMPMEMLREAELKRRRWTSWGFSEEVEWVVAILVGAVFGAIHLIAWNFHFPSVTEMWFWRVSSLVLTVAPFGVVLFSSSAHYLRNHDSLEAFFIALGILTWLSYAIARFLLIVLPLISLRDPAPGVFINITWTSLLPHF